MSCSTLAEPHAQQQLRRALTPLPSHGPEWEGHAGAHGQSQWDPPVKQHHPLGWFLSSQELSPKD